MSTMSGSQMITLCVSSDGHLDLKHVTQSCHSCPDSGCQRDEAPVESPATDVPIHDTCCLDLPLMVDLAGWPAPRSTEHGNDDDRLVFADQVRTPVAAGAPAPSPGGRCALLSPDREPPVLTALACVVLLL